MRDPVGPMNGFQGADFVEVKDFLSRVIRNPD